MIAWDNMTNSMYVIKYTVNSDFLSDCLPI